jgi:hypothetical protein
MTDHSPIQGVPLWPLPLLAGLLPVIAALIALFLSMRLELIPACNPFFEGCVSVSRAARHDLPNHIFRAIVIPAAVLQGLTWTLCRSWLLELGAPSVRKLRYLVWFGLIAAVALVIYGAFLGTEGRTYRWLRQYGTILYFGFTCVGMLITADVLRSQGRHRAALSGGRLDHVLLALLGIAVLAGLINKFVAPFFDPETADRIENAAEWWAAAMLCSVFLIFAWYWRRSGYRARLSVKSG